MLAGRQVGAAYGRGVSDTRQTSVSRPQLTAGEVSQGGIKKPQCLGWAVAAVNPYKQSRLDAPLADCTVSRQEDPVKLTSSQGGLTTVDTSRPTPYTGAARLLSAHDLRRRYDRHESSV